MRRAIFIALLLAVPFVAPTEPARAGTSDPELHTFRHENVLGTSCELRVRSRDRAAAEAAERIALAEIDRLAAILSSYSDASEFSRWQATRNQAMPVSGELFEVLAAAEQWRDRSGGAFNVGAEAFTRLWQAAARNQTPPPAAELASTVDQVAAPAWRLDTHRRTATHLSDCPLSLNAIAKGYIIERASTLAGQMDGIAGLLLEIGGDLRVRGRLAERVALVDPRNDAENAPPLTAVTVCDAALATSGAYRRGVQIGGRHFSHIIDPRTGQPADRVPGATVIAPDAATADALATAFSVMSPDESVRLADATPGVACSLVGADGTIRRSSRWPAEGLPVAGPTTASVASTSLAQARSAAADSLELCLKFEINHPEGGRYLRPYVAVWIEDREAFPVRTLLLWLLAPPKGERWISDLRRWSRGDQMRRLVDPQDLVATISGATRNPGEYSVTWDGKDDHGQPVKPGTYTLYLEAAREHGTYQLMKHEFSVGGTEFTAAVKGNEEIKGATLEYRRRSPQP